MNPRPRTTAVENDMANRPDAGDVFDVRKVRKLVELMNEHELAEIDLKQGDQRIRLRKGGEPVMMTAAPMAAPAAAAPSAPAAPVATKPAADDPNAIVIKSPMVGTFYASANPESAPFIKVGDQVGPTTTICIIEAMKVFNEIPAEVSGKVLAVLVETGSAVEFGQPLFKLQK
jgi:acetyl-CoA carboxylase biotin carboxyl carrier protein